MTDVSAREHDAIAFLRRLEPEDGIGWPEAGVEQDGAISFDWGVGGRVASLSFADDGVVHYAWLYDGEMGCGELAIDEALDVLAPILRKEFP